jgi:hypothetical protein
LLLLAGVAATTWTFARMWDALTWLRPGGGIGAVSSGLLLDVLVIAALLVVNVGLAGPARRHGPLASSFRRAHLWVLAGYAAWAVASAVLFTRTSGRVAVFRAGTVLGVIGAPFLPLQLFFAASVLAFLIGNPRMPTRRGLMQR